ncbi:MAG: UDP-3-O-(3-hydroxymyristoyl)glucosamine N-acyltransferase [Rickettsiales bacterium]|jgi:UDP-3-O-[3-hydroxymyristoyl] glucosamine N-acyltransferase|nr:UDP-3-O-(3-hydroxymyristoyl)glucosamine N-acyltransferase [Rickettsiales bacterium]
MNINYRGFFTKKREYVTIWELAKMVDILNISSLNLEDKIYNVRPLSDATADDISFLSNEKYTSQLETTGAGFCFVDAKFSGRVGNGGKTKLLATNNPRYACAVLLKEFFSTPIFEIGAGISDRATVSPTAKIGSNTEIQAGAVIFDGASIGNNCKICANAVINHGCVLGDNNYVGANSVISYAVIGNNNIIQSGASIGHCGFGFVFEKNFNHKIPQIGIVKIGNFVEIGAGCSVARGALGDTVIEDMVKLDCLAHIAHGVKVGAGCFIAGQTGIAGSAELGTFCQVGGNVSINGHIKIGDFSVIAGRSGVVKSTAEGERVGGYPAVPIWEWRRQTVALKKLLKKGKNDE